MKNSEIIGKEFNTEHAGNLGIDIGGYDFEFIVNSITDYGSDDEEIDFTVLRGEVTLICLDDNPVINIHEALVTEKLWECNYEVKEIISEFIKKLKLQQ